MKRIYVIFAVVAMLVAACGGGSADTETFDDAAATETGSQSDTNATDDQTETSEGVTDSSTDTDTDTGDDGELTLNDFSPGFSGVDFEETDWRAEELRVQQLVAECMAEEGFEYIPFVPSDIGGGFGGYDEFDEEEYVKQYGFGVATWVLQEEEFIYDEENDPYADDPNRAIEEAMDELEREEYYRVLYGGEPEIIENTPWEEIEAMSPEEQDAFYNEAYANWEPTGCMNTAWESIYDYGEMDAFYEEFSDDLDAFYQRAESDSRIVDLQSDWSACMAEKGHDYATQQDMYGYFYGDEFGEGEFSQRVNELIVYPEPDPSLFEDLEEGEEPEYDPSLWAPQYDIELLQPLIDEELAVALANYECSQGMNEVMEEVYKDLERQFIEENIDALRAYQEANG